MGEDPIAKMRESAAELRGFLKAMPPAPFKTNAGQLVHTLANDLFPALVERFDELLALRAETEELRAALTAAREEAAQARRERDAISLFAERWGPCEHSRDEDACGSCVACYEVRHEHMTEMRDAARREAEEARGKALAEAAEIAASEAERHEQKERDGVLEEGVSHHAAVYLRQVAREILARGAGGEAATAVDWPPTPGACDRCGATEDVVLHGASGIRLCRDGKHTGRRPDPHRCIVAASRTAVEMHDGTRVILSPFALRVQDVTLMVRGQEQVRLPPAPPSPAAAPPNLDELCTCGHQRRHHGEGVALYHGECIMGGAQEPCGCGRFLAAPRTERAP
jgi:hypothetical protein